MARAAAICRHASSCRGIAVPTLVLAWDTDPGHPLSTAEDLVELIPQAELEVAGQLADVVSWTDRVEEFLDRIGG